MIGATQDGWLLGWDRIPGRDSGTWAPDNEDAPKIVAHTTEGYTIGDAVNAFHANNSWPHVTADPVEKSRVQHNPLTKAARALRNTTTPGQTNREARVFQIEIVGTSHNRENAKGKTSVQDFTDEQLDWLGTHVFAPVAAATGTPLVTTVGWYGEDCGWTLASPTARQRLTAAQFDTYTGVLPHAVVPENDHWDCGPLNIDRILAAARGHILKPQPPSIGDDDMATAHRDPRDGKVWIVSGAGRWHVPSRDRLNELVALHLVKPFGGNPPEWPKANVSTLDHLPIIAHTKEG